MESQRQPPCRTKGHGQRRGDFERVGTSEVGGDDDARVGVRAGEEGAAGGIVGEGIALADYGGDLGAGADLEPTW